MHDNSLGGFHECFISLSFHLLEHLLVVREASLVNYFPDLSFDPASNHAVDGVLLALNGLLLWLFFDVWVDFGMEGKLLYRFLVLHLWWFFVSPLLQWFLFGELVQNLWSSVACLRIKEIFPMGRTVVLAILRLFQHLMIAFLNQALLFTIFALWSTGCQRSTSLGYGGCERKLILDLIGSFHFSKGFHAGVP